MGTKGGMRKFFSMAIRGARLYQSRRVILCPAAAWLSPRACLHAAAAANLDIGELPHDDSPSGSPPHFPPSIEPAYGGRETHWPLFSELGLFPVLADNMQALGFTHQTPVQAKSIPYALAGQDLLISAITGSGKTAAFVLPMLQRLMQKHPCLLSSTASDHAAHPVAKALVLCPTAELAEQTARVVRSLSQSTSLTCSVLHSGSTFEEQNALLAHATVVVATPGQWLKQHAGGYRMPALDCLVIDEADCLFDEHFLTDIKAILFHLPNPYEGQPHHHARQTFFVSASLPVEARALALSMLRRFDTRLCVLQNQSRTPSHISHSVFPCPAARKPFLLLKLLTDDQPIIEQAVVFVGSRQRCNQTSNFLSTYQISNNKLHAQCM